MSDSETQSTVPSEVEDDAGSDDQNIFLIRLVRKKAFLYTKKDKRYSDRNLTERAWTHIAAEIGLTKDEAKEKWTRLRNNFSKVLARRKAKTPSGSAASTPFKPWVYETEMEFLKRHVVSQSKAMSSSIRTVIPPTPSPTPSTSTVAKAEPQAEDSQADEGVQLEDSHDGLGNVDISTAPGQRPKKSSKSLYPVDEVMLSCMQTMTNQNEEPLLLWFKSLLPTLKTLPPERLLSFQINVMQENQRLISQVHSQS